MTFVVSLTAGLSKTHTVPFILFTLAHYKQSFSLKYSQSAGSRCSFWVLIKAHYFDIVLLGWSAEGKERAKRD